MKISIITAAFNSARTIEDTILSVAEQTFPEVEHLIVDGASSDQTRLIIRKHADKIATSISEPDNGMYDAMNKGLALASGDVIGVLNSDDMYAHTRVLADMAAGFEDPAVEVCYADLVYVDPHDTNRVVRYMPARDYRAGLFERGWCPPHPTFFVRKAVYDRLGGFDLGYTIGNDVELMMRFLVRYGIKSKYIPGIMVKMRRGGESNRSIGNIIRQNREILKAARNNGITIAPVTFVLAKILSRFRQYKSRSDKYVGVNN
jgi:glycosyltransferase involved in cell wall biosynthesis